MLPAAQEAMPAPSSNHGQRSPRASPASRDAQRRADDREQVIDPLVHEPIDPAAEVHHRIDGVHPEQQRRRDQTRAHGHRRAWHSRSATLRL